MFLGTLSGPFFNHLIESSSVGFTELILTGERVEAGIKSGKIQKDASASAATKRTFPAKKEVSVVYSQRSQGRIERRPAVGAVMIQKSTADQPRNNQPRTNQARVERPSRLWAMAVVSGSISRMVSGARVRICASSCLP